ncbi:gnat family protein [Rutstroemia sp. NJR-2017a WRK4]|nr:gnat family protein [Rutstroemia sp. NJR-2017a WRK4]
MPLQLLPCTDADMARTFAILSDAFGHEHPYIEAAFPAHETPAGRAAGGERMLAIKNSDPTATFLKVVDTKTGEMIAQAKWNIFKDNIPPELDLDGDFWGDDLEEKEYAQHLCREYLIPRRKAIRESGGNLVSLDLLTVDPKHQRRGAGRMLVQWGTKKADELGFTAVVEASDYGRDLYESEGFQEIERWESRLPEKWAHRGKQKFIWMVRPAKKAE